MADPAFVPETLVWTDAAHAPAAGRILDLMGGAARPLAVGGPRCAAVTELGRRLECPVDDDLRKLLIDRPAAFLLLATGEDVSRQDLAHACGQGTIVLALEPAASGLDGLLDSAPKPAGPAPAGAAGAGWVARLPAFQRCPGWLHAAAPAEVLGDPRVVLFTSVGPAEDCSLFARLHDAWHVVLQFGDLPEVVHASLTGPAARVPENPRELTGYLSVHARLPGQRSALLLISDQVARPQRRLRVHGDSAHLEIGELDYQLHSLTGDLIDHHAPAASAPPLYLDQVVQQWSALLDRRAAELTRPTPASAGPPELSPDRAALACCLACLLSARTGQAESPASVLEMRRGRGR